MVLARANPLIGSCCGLDLLQTARDIGIPFDSKLRAAERQVRRNVLSDYDPRGLGSAPGFWVDSKVQATLIGLIDNAQIRHRFEGREHQLDLLRAGLCAMPDSFPKASGQVKRIEAIDIVRGAEELLRRVPEAQEEWSSATVRAAISLWWDYHDVQFFSKILKQRNLLSDVHAISPDIAKMLGTEVIAVEVVGPQYHHRLAAATKDVMGAQPELIFAQYERRIVAIAEKMGLRAQSVRRRLKRDPRILGTMHELYPEEWAFIVESDFHHRLVAAVNRVKEVSPELEFESEIPRTKAVGELLGMTDEWLRVKLREEREILEHVRRLDADAAAFLENTEFHHRLAAAAETIMQNDPTSAMMPLKYRRSAVGAVLGLNERSLSNRLKGKLSVASQLTEINKEAARFVMDNSLAYKMAGEIREVIRCRPELVFASKRERRKGFCEVTHVSRQNLSQRFFKTPDLRSEIAARCPEAAGFFSAPTFHQRLAAAALIVKREQPELADASYSTRVREIGRRMGLAPRSLQVMLGQDERYLQRVRALSPGAATFIGRPKSRKKPVDPMSFRKFLRRAREAKELGIKGYYAIMHHIGRGWYVDGNAPQDASRRYEKFRGELRIVAPEMIEYIGDRPDVNVARPITAQQVVEYARQLIEGKKYRAGDYYRILFAMSRLHGYASPESLFKRMKDPLFRRKVAAIDAGVLRFIGRSSREAPAKPMPVQTVIDCSRPLMEAGMTGSIHEKLAAVTRGWYRNIQDANARLLQLEFMTELLGADEEVAYWIHPWQADTVQMYLAWKAAGGRLVDPAMTPLQAYERLRAGEPIVAHGLGEILLQSGIWMINGEKNIDVATLNDGISSSEEFERALAIYRNLKIVFGGQSVGIIGFRGLAYILNVSVADIMSAFGDVDSQEIDESSVDMDKVFGVYEGLTANYMHWYETLFGYGNRFGYDFKNILYEALYEAAKAAVYGNATSAEDLEDVVEYSAIAYMKQLWGRMCFTERPVLCDEDRAFLVADYQG